jgi:hypothetical protein
MYLKEKQHIAQMQAIEDSEEHRVTGVMSLLKRVNNTSSALVLRS